MDAKLQVLIAIIVSGLLAGNAGAATITFDKSLDVPDRTFTWDNNNYTITHVGNYKLNDNINFGISSGTDYVLVILYDAEKLSKWDETKQTTGGQISMSIPAGTVITPGIYGIVVQYDTKIIGANPLIISEYDMTVTPNTTQANPGSVIKVTVAVSKNGAPVSVAPNNVKVEFVQDSTSTHFGDNAVATATGTYVANIQVPSGASGSYWLYAAITTSKDIYDYPEIIGAAGYSGTIDVPTLSSTSTTSSGGGGGGSGPSGEDFENIELRETYEKYISRDAPASYVFRQAGNPVSEVLITSNINAGDTAVKIEVLRGTSSMVSNPPPETVYKNINLWVGTSGFAVPENIKNALIKFRVNNSWITENAISSKDIRMFRWDGSQWIQLETVEKEKSAEHTFYEAKTNSFSPFAIAAKAPDSTPITKITATKPETTRALTETTEPTGSGEAKNIPTGIGIILVFIIVIEVYLIKKKK